MSLCRSYAVFVSLGLAVLGITQALRSEDSPGADSGGPVAWSAPALLEDPPRGLVAQSAAPAHASGESVAPSAPEGIDALDEELNPGEDGDEEDEELVDPRLWLQAPGGCSGCGWELGAPDRLVLAPPERGRSGRWISRHRAEDGSWSPGSPADDPCWSRAGHQPGDPRLAVGLTALALLTYVGDGSTHRSGPFKRIVMRGLRWLRERQTPDGAVGRGSSPEAHREQALATFALCELYAVSQDAELRAQAEGALGVCLGPVLDHVTRTVDPVLGGWLLQALQAGRIAGLKVTEDAFVRLRWTFPLEASEHPAVALLAHLAGEGEPRDAASRRVAEALAGQELRWEPGRVDLQAWYFTTFALSRFGGKPWQAWREPLVQVLREAQRPIVHSGEGWRCGVGAPDPPQLEPPMDCREGSWDPIGAWGTLHGRAGSTSLAWMCLQVDDRYERVRLQTE